MTHETALTRLAAQERADVYRHTYLEARDNYVALLFRPFGPGYRGGGPLIEVIHYRPDGSLILNSGGCTVPSVKHRINTFLPEGIGWSVYATRGKWFLTHPTKSPVPFVDGMQINSDGTIL